ncbi:hypothetical protein [Pseudonocardia sediminis]|uniref:hypothetical protein n=1 Tax=Pseudonocardia sediminis TaxID=1397368 RepID=UPI0010288A68|nr:hypothetical protein [Pseudonocardia sediminis]
MTRTVRRLGPFPVGREGETGTDSVGAGLLSLFFASRSARAAVRSARHSSSKVPPRAVTMRSAVSLLETAVPLKVFDTAPMERPE